MVQKLIQALALLAIVAVFAVSSLVGRGRSAPFTIKDFPNSVGDHWVYLYIDTSSYYPYGQNMHVVIDTVRVTVAAQAPGSRDHSTNIWIREFTNRADTLYVTTEGDTVRITKRIFIQFRTRRDTTNPFVELERTRLVFPIKVGKKWSIRYTSASKTYEVAHEDSFETSGHEFKRRFLVKFLGVEPNAGRQTSYWIVPGVGFVEESEQTSETASGPQYEVQTWKLLKYEIKR